jgi:hypothetical protein
MRACLVHYLVRASALSSTSVLVLCLYLYQACLTL